MKIALKLLRTIGFSCLFLGLIAVGVALLTGGKFESLVNHNVAVIYYEQAMGIVNYVLSTVNNAFLSILRLFNFAV